MFGTVRSGMWPVRRYSRSQRGRASASGANRSAALRSIRSGMTGLPQSRPMENDQSRVAISPTAPAARARSSRCTSWSLLPDQ